MSKSKTNVTTYAGINEAPFLGNYLHAKIKKIKNYFNEKNHTKKRGKTIQTEKILIRTQCQRSAVRKNNYKARFYVKSKHWVVAWCR